MINTIIFDIGMVLAHFGWKEYFNEQNYEKDKYEKIVHATVLGDAWKEFDKGLLSDEEVLNLCYRKAPEYKKEIRHLFDNIADYIVEYSYSVAWIQELKEKGYKVYLLSNYAKTTFEIARKRFKFFEYVDGEVISYTIKMVKPNKEIYEYIIKKYHIIPENAVFIDDSLQNIQTAQNLGIHGIHFVKQHDAIKELEILVI